MFFSTLPAAAPKVLPIPKGEPLRAIAAKYYSDGNVYIGGTSGWKKPSRTSGLLDREFSYITPENDFKHQVVHPKPGVWNWKAADAWVKSAGENGQVIRIHGPISPQCSKWAKEDHRTPEELEKSMVEFMTALCKRYNGVSQVKWMDVVNETIEPKKNVWFGPRPGVDRWENPWTRLGFDETTPLRPPRYIKLAFEIANEHAPDIEQIINQHGSVSPRVWDRIFDLVDYLREQGLRVDGIGWQAHVNLGWEKEGTNLKDLEALIARAHAKDLSFHVTENNVWLRKEKDYEAQAETFAAILRTLLSHRHSGEVTWNVWNLSDDDSWQQNRHLDGCIFDYDYAPKPAYYALRNVLLEMK
jgi:GH35 family endo-1,4-beta-xylanase